MVTSEHVDVLIVGAGLSGVGAACRLATRLPGKSYAILEARDAIGGTWDLFRYPGIRSDSDAFTLSYPFRPWLGRKSITDGESILDYIRDTAAEYRVDEHIKFRHRVVGAAWSSAESRWTVQVATGADGQTVTYTCAFLYLCTGYYSYDDGHQVDFPGFESFAGQVVHPQHWPADLDYRDKNVVVIGSGATAVTLVPSLAEQANRVTMLQRSPSYILSLPGRDVIADGLRKVLPGKVAHRIVRGKNVVLTTTSYQLCRRWPRQMSKVLRAGVARQLPKGVPVDPHFVPRYDPWDQRLCVVPGGDLFRAMRKGRADVVTGTIETFTEKGIRLTSGEELTADIIVTATGLRMVTFGQVELTVDGERVVPNQTLAYKGMMFSGVPNLAWCIGYTNNSWTLRADITSSYVCRLLARMDERGYTRCVPQVDPSDQSTKPRPVLDLTSGYVQRAAATLPKQGSKRPWTVRQNYLLDLAAMKLGRVDDGALRFSRAPTAPTAQPKAAGIPST